MWKLGLGTAMLQELLPSVLNGEETLQHCVLLKTNAIPVFTVD